ncbi:hypothetical protein BAE44_0008375 [Dichanthelium oligosanthes]|uniref:Protein LURP-one-related 7 n=1 Tax=Dichanthelium oligosanthes TaxID=888268 RepID=A0A1E5VZP1_9POAL|nr:hypothetical protein BAE44_0008375 [Dichanthelium oligosanthes]
MEQPTASVLPPAPAPEPVPVAWSVVPVDFTVVKKGPEMAMHDATGRLAFRVAGGGGEGGGTTLFDAAGGVLVNVRTSGQGKWEAFSGNSLEQRHVIFTAKVITASSSRKEVHVFIPPRSIFEDPKPSYRLIGSTFRRACTIIKGDSIVAQVM